MFPPLLFVGLVKPWSLPSLSTFPRLLASTHLCPSPLSHTTRLAVSESAQPIGPMLLFACHNTYCANRVTNSWIRPAVRDTSLRLTIDPMNNSPPPRLEPRVWINLEGPDMLRSLNVTRS